MEKVEIIDPQAVISKEQEVTAKIFSRVREYSVRVQSTPEYRYLLRALAAKQRSELETLLKIGIDHAVEAIDILEGCFCEETRMDYWRKIENEEIPEAKAVLLAAEVTEPLPYELQEGVERLVGDSLLAIEINRLMQYRDLDKIKASRPKSKIDRDKFVTPEDFALAISTGHNLIINRLEFEANHKLALESSLVNGDA